MDFLRKNVMQQRGLIAQAIAFCMVLVACSEAPSLKIGLDRRADRNSFAGVLAYYVASLLLAGLEKNPARDGLTQSLLELASYQGLQSHFKVDRFGDVVSKLFLTAVDGGQFKVVD